MFVTERNAPSDARPVGGSESVSGEDEYIPRKGVVVRPNFRRNDYVSRSSI